MGKLFPNFLFFSAHLIVRQVAGACAVGQNFHVLEAPVIIELVIAAGRSCHLDLVDHIQSVVRLLVQIDLLGCAVVIPDKVNTQQLITFGILFGTFIGSLGTIVVTNAPTGDLLKQYYLWGAANFKLEGVTTGDIIFSLCLFAAGIAAALLDSSRLTAHFKGEIELGNLHKALSLLAIMCLVTSAVSICGPIGFISLGVPNLSRIICKKEDIRVHYLISSAMGVGLLLITYFVVQYVNFGIYLPVSATMALLALPLMAIIFIKK